jgi:hypothetical protein
LDVEAITRQKASMLKNRVAFIEEVYGEDALAKVIAAMPEEHQGILDQPLLPSNWITMDASAAFLDATAVVLGGDQVIYDMGLYGAQKSLSGIYKIFVMIGSPGFIVRRGAVTFKQLFEGGHSEARAEEQDGRMNAVWRSYGFAAHHRLIEVVMHGWMVEALRLSGADVDHSRVVVSLTEDKGFFEVEGGWDKK